MVAILVDPLLYFSCSIVRKCDGVQLLGSPDMEIPFLWLTTRSAPYTIYIISYPPSRCTILFMLCYWYVLYQDICELTSSIYIPRGINVTSLNHDQKWPFQPSKLFRVNTCNVECCYHIHFLSCPNTVLLLALSSFFLLFFASHCTCYSRISNLYPVY